MTAVDHLPWIGASYATQPSGDRLLIAGFSHHGRFSDAEADHPDFTNQVVRDHAIPGGIRFFDAIADYFGEERAAFWSRVAFINTLGSTVGDEVYSDGTDEQRAAAAPRALRIVQDLTPDRIFVFTTKGWKGLWPDYTGHVRDGTMRLPSGAEVDYGTYAHGNGEAIAFGLRHPQYAIADQMRAVVKAALAHTP